MKKIVLTAAAGLLITAGVTAAVLNTGKEEAPVGKKSNKEECPVKKCSRMKSTACY